MGRRPAGERNDRGERAAWPTWFGRARRPSAPAAPRSDADAAGLRKLRVACDLARLPGQLGRGAEARAILESLYGRFTEGFDAPDLVDATALLAAPN
jgi:hypothetical protein